MDWRIQKNLEYADSTTYFNFSTLDYQSISMAGIALKMQRKQQVRRTCDSPAWVERQHPINEING